MPKPMPCQVVTMITERSAAVPLPCQSMVGSPTRELIIWLRMPVSGSNRRKKMMPEATPEITTGT